MEQNDDDAYWDLGPPQAVRPEALLTRGTRDPLEEFFLALALVFNDIKTVVLVQATVQKEIQGQGVSARVGQRNGLSSHLDRLAAGIVHELLELIERNTDVLADARFKAIADEIPPKCRSMWQRLVEHASGGGSASSVLLLIRNNAAFHYYQPRAVADGFRAWFFDDVKIEQNTRAYVSVGKDMDATRFYYADAAAQRSMSILATKKGVADVHAMISGLVKQTNFALAALVRQYIHSRDPQSGVAPMPRFNP